MEMGCAARARTDPKKTPGSETSLGRHPPAPSSRWSHVSTEETSTLCSISISLPLSSSPVNSSSTSFSVCTLLKMRKRVVHVVRPSLALRSTSGSTISWLNSWPSKARYVARPGPWRSRVSTINDGSCASAGTPAEVRRATTIAEPSKPIGTGRSCSSRSSAPRGATSHPPAEQPAVLPGGSTMGCFEPSSK